jgi:hypothetical protein
MRSPIRTTVRLWAVAILAASVASCDDEGGSRGDIDNGDAATFDAGTPSNDGGRPTVAAPTFSLQPKNQTVAAGDKATFTVTASGAPSPSLQWQSSTDDGATWTDRGGATAATYTTSAVSIADSGTLFRVVATNSEGSATSAPARLTVTSVPTTVGKLVITSPPTVIRDDATAPVPIPAPNGAVVARAHTAGGRIILAQDSSKPQAPSLVSVRPDGTGRVVLVDASTLPTDTVALNLVAVAPNDTVYYMLVRGAGSDVHLGSIKSDGTGAATPVQLTGGATGMINVTFHGTVPFNDAALEARYKVRIFTNDSRLVYSETGSDGAQARVRVISPDLTVASTVLTNTPGHYESVCGVTPQGKVVYTRSRTSMGSIFDAFTVNLDGSGITQLNAAATTTLYDCSVTVSGRVLFRTSDPTNRTDLYLASAAGPVPLAVTADDEAFVGESADGRIVYVASDSVTGHQSLHVVEAGGGNMKTLTPKTDTAGPFGGLVALTPAGRAIIVRATIFGGPQSLHSVRLDGTGRVDLLPAGKFRGYEPFGVTANSRLIYRGTDATDSIRLFSLRTDALISAGVPDQTILRNDPTVHLSLLLD